MTLDEFINLIEERKELVHDIDSQDNFSRIQQIDKSLCFDSWRKYHENKYYKKLYLDCMMQSGYSRLFDIGHINAVEILKRYFKDDDAEIKYTLYPNSECPKHLELTTQKQSYDLGSDNTAFYCLYTEGSADWEILMQDYPSLRGYLWNEFNTLRENEFKLLQNGERIKSKPISLISLPEENQEELL